MKLRLILLSALCIFIAGCSKTNVDPYKSYRKYSSHQLYRIGINDLVKEHYGEAAKEFEALNGLYPFGPDAEPAQLDLIYAYYKDSQKPAAVAAADRYIRLYPQNKNIAYAYYMRGRVQFNMGLTWLQRLWGTDPAPRSLINKKQAFLAFSQLARFYPTSPYAQDAIVRMHYIRNEIARKELLISDYYWDRGAYVASANRASAIVQHYQGTSMVKPALVMMVKSYRKLNEMQMANNSLRILRASFPNAPELKSLS
ncbi:MAG: outer membrane protein assembly factor BamD [Coxiella sp. (in: Bacteria)]|nr:MAG: outer membrane protein assembly factor BamD [Coxiella sp. (in: g-proteobacteria)]